MTIDVFDIHKKKTGTLELPDAVFGAPWNPDLVHQIVVSHLANARGPIAHTKDRGEVKGGGKKPWRQKHTGRARHGSTRSPLWVKGGVAHGPRNERDFSKKISKKMGRAALCAVLSKKLHDGEVVVIDSLAFDAGKTKHAVAFLKAFFPRPVRTLIVPQKGNTAVFRAGRNIPKTEVANAASLNAYTCMAHHTLFFEKGAIGEIVKAK